MDYDPSPELNRYNLDGPQSEQQPKPATIASSAESFVPTTKLTFVTGTVQLEWIGTHVAAAVNPTIPEHAIPVEPGYHELVLIFTNGSPGAFVTTGNIKTAYTPIQNRPVVLYYDPSTALYWVQTVT